MNWYDFPAVYIAPQFIKVLYVYLIFLISPDNRLKQLFLSFPFGSEGKGADMVCSR